jgi:chitinase
MFRRKILITAFILLTGLLQKADAQDKNNFAVIAYWAGHDPAQLDSFSIEKLSHIIFSFCHLKGAELHVDNARDTLAIRKLASLKNRNPGLKVMLSLGGWGGCASCSDVFSLRKNRRLFAASVKNLCRYFEVDGIDLDWEYPAISGFPNHRYKAEDRENFTKLVKRLRKTLGSSYVISFAAGGFSEYIDHAVEWKKVMKRVNYANLMTYDLVSGYSKTTGHHTPLYPNGQQVESIDHAVQKIAGLGVPKNKLVIGAAFYGRIWEAVADTNTGLYQQGKFKQSMAYKQFSSQLSADSGFVYHWDEKAMAPYYYNPARQLFVTHDDQRSMGLKTKYALDQGLGGIMFWELSSDAYNDGLLDAIDKARRLEQ